MRAVLHFFCVLGLVCAGVLFFSASASAQQPAPDPAKRDEAIAHFDQGLAHFDREEWDAALVEFLRSRELYPTASNTRNAARCLRKVGRFDEALDMWEHVAKDFSDLSDKDREIAQREIKDLRASVGSIELRGLVIGAKVVVDGRERGVAPLAGPVRVGVGTHTVQVSREGYLPFETRVDVAGMQTVPVNVELAALTAAGRLRVSEQTGKSLEVVVDNAVVGNTPWEGALAPGDHTVLLRGEKNLGTQPASAAVKLHQLVTLNLLAEELEGELKVDPVPPAATLTIDAVPLGHGAWQGRLRLGQHTIEAAAEGYLPWKRDVDLQKGAPQAVKAELQRDPNAALGGPSGTFVLEVGGTVGLGLAWGGDLESACTGSCSAGFPLGTHAVLHGTYETASGFGAGLDVGYLALSRTLNPRAASLTPMGSNPDNGTVSDALTLSGLTAGASAQYHHGDTWPLLIRLGAGVFVGNESDNRTGTLTDSRNASFSVSFSDAPSAVYFYVAPEVRIGRRFGQHFELNVGVEALLLKSLKQPTWSDGGFVGAGHDGVGSFPAQTLAGSFMLVLAPGIGARYAF